MNVKIEWMYINAPNVTMQTVSISLLDYILLVVLSLASGQN